MKRLLRTRNAFCIPDEIGQELINLRGAFQGITPDRLVALVRHPAELLRRGWVLTGQEPVVWSLGSRTLGQRIHLCKARHQAVLESQAGRCVHRFVVCLRQGKILQAGYALE
jgi:hypothetical protein